LTPLALLTLSLGGCGDARSESGGIIDVRPTRLGLGDALIIEGEQVVKPDPSRISFRPPPSFRAKAQTTIILDGKFTYPGRVRKGSSTPEVEEKRVELPAAAPPALADPAWAERVVARMTAGTRRLIGYAHFEGRLGVRQVEDGDAVERWTPIKMTFFRPDMRSLADLVARYTCDWQVRSWLGIKTKPVEGGIEVTEVRPNSLAAHKNRLQVGDRLVKVDGLVIHSERQLTVAARKMIKRSVMSIKASRGGREFTARFGAKEGIGTASGNTKTVTKPPIIPVSVVYLMVMLIFGVVALTVALVTAGLLTWVERRVAGRIQSRIGPNRVGPQGILQWLADGIKLLLKEDVIPDAVDRPLFKLAPYLVFMGLLGTFVVLPFGQFLIISDLNVGLLYLLAITGFVSLGLMMAGWSSNNKWSLLGGMRSAAQIISYEIPSGLALMVPVVLAGTLSTHAIVEQQGGWPWQWYAFDNPFAFACFVIYFISALAEGNRTPFDLPEAESELVAGYQIEYSGWRFAVFMMSEWANIFVIGAVAATVFLGGWQVPGLTVAEQATSVWWQLAGLVIFYAKSMGLVFVIIWIRWTLPRFRVDQMMALCWKYFVPWCFVSIIVVAIWAMVAPPWMRLLGALGTTGLCGGGLAFLFFSRVYYNWRKNPEDGPWSWNPFY
jgi:NADH-quinone oxidoreductase subunit H